MLKMSEPEFQCPICGTVVDIVKEGKDTYFCKCPKCRAKFHSRKVWSKDFTGIQPKEEKFNPSER